MGLPNVFSYGNVKLNDIINFNLPAIETCPGATETCLKACYATKRRYKWQNIKNMYERNLALVKSGTDFVTVANAFFIMNRFNEDTSKIVRIHSSGDFFSNDYISQWIEIAKANPDWTFYAYTRSWRVPELLAKLNEFRLLTNVNLYASTDETSGVPPVGWLEAGFLNTHNEEYKECYRELHCDECRHCVEGRGNVRFMKSL